MSAKSVAKMPEVFPPSETDLVYEEMARQPYKNCVFSAGFVEGHPVDTLYVRLARDGDGEPTTILLRPDEAQAICWVLNGALWSDQMRRLSAEEGVEHD